VKGLALLQLQRDLLAHQPTPDSRQQELLTLSYIAAYVPVYDPGPHLEGEICPGLRRTVSPLTSSAQGRFTSFPSLNPSALVN
jgi:hypothetical protein